MSSVKKYKNAGWKGFIRAGWEDIFSDLDKIAVSGQQIVNKGNREVRRIETDKGVVFYKRMIKLKSTLPHCIFSRLPLPFHTPSSFSVWKVSEELLASDLGCALPLLAIYRRNISNVFSEDIFVATEITFPLISKMLREAADETQRKIILEKAGRGIRELHDKGFVHGDCIPGNVCMDDEAKLYFIDNDRTVKYAGFRPRYAKRRNMIQFCTRAMSWLTELESLDHFLNGYYENDSSVDKIAGEKIFRKKLNRRIKHLEKELNEKLLAKNFRREQKKKIARTD